MSNPICSLREKISTNNHALRRRQNLLLLQIKQNSQIVLLNVKHLVSNGLLLKLVTNSTCIKKENHYLLLILTITWVTVLRRGQFLVPHVTFNIDMVKYKNICKLLKTLQMNKKQKKQYIQRNENYKPFSEEMEINSKKVTFQSIFIKL